MATTGRLMPLISGTGRPGSVGHLYRCADIQATALSRQRTFARRPLTNAFSVVAVQPIEPSTDLVRSAKITCGRRWATCDMPG